jgi:hypothetical protein
VKIVNVACGGLLALIVAAACGGKSSESGGSNTNWFATCSANAECGSGLECWCGICTSPCATDCDSAPAAATCAMPPAACAEPSEKHACAIACTSDAACKSLGAGATCVGSICRKGVVRSGKVSCDESSTEAYDRVEALVESADRSCESTEDCIEFPGVSCRHHCSVGIVSKAGAAAVEGRLDVIEEEVCKPFAAAGCVVTEPPCVFPGTPTCVAGTCRHLIPGQTDAGATCDERFKQIGDRLEAALDSADRRCSSAADCTRVHPVDECFAECEAYPYPISKRAASDFESTRAAVDRELCDAYLADGCRPNTLFGCPAPPPLQCIDGFCMNDFTGTVSDGGAQPSCADRATRWSDAATDIATSMGGACLTSQDCRTLMVENPCGHECGYLAVAEDSGLAVGNALDAIQAPSCSDCAGPPKYPCPPVPEAICQNGKCVRGNETITPH